MVAIAVLALASVVLLPFNLLERVLYGRRIAACRLDDDPVVVLGHGFALRTADSLGTYATRFVQEGMAALMFDYRGFGTSTGMPREVVDGYQDRTSTTRLNGADAVSFSVRKQSGANTVEITDRVEAVLDPRAGPVSGDPSRLQQVIWNLLSNAIKFTPEGGQVRVDVRSRDDGFIQVNVIDTGAGIPSDELDKVFLRFYRSASASPTAQGAGLGLTIAKNLVELHGGRIWATSALGSGSCFSFTVPTLSPPTESPA